jgi:hypothetical protein
MRDGTDAHYDHLRNNHLLIEEFFHSQRRDRFPHAKVKFVALEQQKAVVAPLPKTLRSPASDRSLPKRSGLCAVTTAIDNDRSIF